MVDHYTYSIVSDGDLMEGVASEAASLAGYLRLGKLIYLYDDNDISIEGETDMTFTENVRRRFEAYAWDVRLVRDGTDLRSIERAISDARREKNRPSLIIVRTHIGYGSPKQDSAKAHGEPLGPEAVKATKEKLGWPLEPAFYTPEGALKHFRESIKKGKDLEGQWKKLFASYKENHPDLARELSRAIKGEIPKDLDKHLPKFSPSDGPIATRSASGTVMNAFAKGLPHQLMGGSGDLAPSTKTLLLGYGDFGFHKACAHNLHFGVREHAMGAAVNGMALHGGIIPYGATFLIFSDYMRPALRLSALMQVHSIFVFTHDSIGLGEDGPTHQPIEHLMSLRTMPGMTLIRPADSNETAIAWKIAIELKGPVALALTRQKLPVLDTHKYPVLEGVQRGAYVLAEAESNKPDIIIIASGSEVHLALEAREELKKNGVQARVVSMPSWELFEKQSDEYKKKVLIPLLPKLAVEAGSALGWCTYVGERGSVIGLNRFGASAPGNIVMAKLGFNVENVVNKAAQLLERYEK
jgi:transketolase